MQGFVGAVDRIPAPLLLAGVLAAHGVRFVTVGSAALRLAGMDMTVHDLDIVPDLDSPNLGGLRAALDRYDPTSSAFPRHDESVDIHPTTTIFGPLDVMFGQARQEGTELRSGGITMSVLDVPIRIGPPRPRVDLPV